MECTKCGAKNDDANRFCGSCGAELTAAEPVGEKTAQILGATVALPVAAPPPAAPPPAPPEAAAPQYVAPRPVAPPPPLPATPSAAAAPRSSGPMIALAAVCVVLLLLIGALAGRLYQGSHTPPGADNTAIGALPAEDTEHAATPERKVRRHEAEAAKPEGVAPAPKPAPEPSEDPVAEASVVLENYLAADLGHDGEEMAKYLGGQAAARFRPEVQGQEDITVHSKKVSGHEVRDANTINFTVDVEWSSEGSDEVKTDSASYVLKRTDKGWKIVSTPEYQ